MNYDLSPAVSNLMQSFCEISVNTGVIILSFTRALIYAYHKSHVKDKKH